MRARPFRKRSCTLVQIPGQAFRASNNYAVKVSSEWGQAGFLPDVVGDHPALGKTNPGMAEVQRGKIVGRNSDYRNSDGMSADGMRKVLGPGMSQIFYSGNGPGVQGGQQYADGDIVQHTGLLRGLLNKINGKHTAFTPDEQIKG